MLVFRDRGTFPNRQFNLSGYLRNEEIALFPRLGTDFTVGYQNEVADILLENSSVLGVSIGETDIRAELNSDLPSDIDIEATFAIWQGFSAGIG